jgi:DNA-binding transcriptional MerR regulator
MFRIGEFAQIAQVSGRQLRFYDQLGLLRPARIDPQTGYRYYSIRQLPRLNSILALKELGLSLEQIGPLLQDEISPADLRAMLTMKRAQVEQSLREDEARLRHIESRIAQIDRRGGIGDYDVVVKSVAPTPFLSLRCSCENMDEVVRMVRTVAEDGGRLIRPSLRDRLIVVARNDHDDEKLDLEIGFSLTRASNASVRITGDYLLRAGELPAVETMATLVRPGTNTASHSSFGAIGMWIEANATRSPAPAAKYFSNRLPARPVSKEPWSKSSFRYAKPPERLHFQRSNSARTRLRPGNVVSCAQFRAATKPGAET